MQKLFVKDAMTKKVITTTLNSPLSEVAEVMSKNGIKGTPVLIITADWWAWSHLQMFSRSIQTRELR